MGASASEASCSTPVRVARSLLADIDYIVVTGLLGATLTGTRATNEPEPIRWLLFSLRPCRESYVQSSLYPNCISLGCVLIFSSQAPRWFYKHSHFRMQHTKILHAFLSFTVPDTSLAHHNILDPPCVLFFIVYLMTMPTAQPIQ